MNIFRYFYMLDVITITYTTIIIKYRRFAITLRDYVKAELSSFVISVAERLGTTLTWSFEPDADEIRELH